MSNYTLRTWVDATVNEYADIDFATLPELYNSIFSGWTPEEYGTPKGGFDPSRGFAVYDNQTDLCINSINAAMVGMNKTQPWQDFNG